MTPKDIVLHLQKLFDPTTSPGQAFDALFKMRQERVTWDDAYKAVMTHGRAVRTLQRLDESEDTFECPGCGIARTNRAYCINPQCPEHKPNPETERIERESAPPKFKNPKLSFGQYKDKTLMEAGQINPSYLTWLKNKHESAFWREQAALAEIALAALAPPNRDTSDTGFFG